MRRQRKNSGCCCCNRARVLISAAPWLCPRHFRHPLGEAAGQAWLRTILQQSRVPGMDFQRKAAGWAGMPMLAFLALQGGPLTRAANGCAPAAK